MGILPKRPPPKAVGAAAGAGTVPNPPNPPVAGAGVDPNNPPVGAGAGAPNNPPPVGAAAGAVYVGMYIVYGYQGYGYQMSME